MDLSDIDGMSIAIVVEIGGASRIIRGTARCEIDEVLGRFIRVRLPAEGQPDSASFIFYEKDASYRIARDEEFGCDLCVRLTAADAQQPKMPTEQPSTDASEPEL